MKNKKVLWTVLPFMAGAIFGISLLGLFSFSSQQKTVISEPVLNPVNLTSARQFYLNYITNAPVYNQKLKGFTFEKAGLTAMKAILDITPAAAGFRVIFGKDRSNNTLAMICAVDSAGADLTTTMYSFIASKVGPCPPNCDLKVGPCPPNCDINSPITR